MRMQWILRHWDDISELSDDFTVGRFRLRLEGNSLTVEAKEEADDELLSAARDLAARYINILRKHVSVLISPMTVEEFASMPAQAITIRRATSAERMCLKNAVRRARHEFFAAGEPCLQRCYDYIDQVHEDEHNCLFHLYNFVETLENAFGGEAKLMRALNMNKAVKDLKKLANDCSYYGTRHAAKVSGEVKRLSVEDRAAAMDYAYQILCAYEGYVHLTKSGK